MGTSIWYWRAVVPDFYEDETVTLFVIIVSLAAAAYCAILIGAWLRHNALRGGQAIMILGEVGLAPIILSTFITFGLVLMPSLLLATFASVLPAPKRMVGEKNGHPSS